MDRKLQQQIDNMLAPLLDLPDQEDEMQFPPDEVLTERRLRELMDEVFSRR